jgi:hypothetical protein
MILRFKTVQQDDMTLDTQVVRRHGETISFMNTRSCMFDDSTVIKKSNESSPNIPTWPGRFGKSEE